MSPLPWFGLFQIHFSFKQKTSEHHFPPPRRRISPLSPRGKAVGRNLGLGGSFAWHGEFNFARKRRALESQSFWPARLWVSQSSNLPPAKQLSLRRYSEEIINRYTNISLVSIINLRFPEILRSWDILRILILVSLIPEILKNQDQFFDSRISFSTQNKS